MALADYSGPTCPDSCGDVSLPAVDIQECVDSIEVELSEITDIYLVATDSSGDAVVVPTDWTSEADWTAVLDQSLDNKIRHLIVSGDKPATEDTEATFSKFRTKVTNRGHTVNADVDDVSDLNYEFMRTLQCGATVRMWFATYGGKLYGGATGIKADVKANYALERGQESRALIQFVFTWDHLQDPPRIANPLAAAAS